MNYEKAAKIATQFEKDYASIYTLLSIEDNRCIFHDQSWFTCKYLNVITNTVVEIEFPDCALETCRIKEDDDKHNRFHGYKEITVDGCNVFWHSITREAELVQADIDVYINLCADELQRLTDFNLSEIDEKNVLKLIKNADKILEKIKADKNKS